jgi:cytochrome P450
MNFLQQINTDPLGVTQSLHQRYGDVVFLKLGPYNWYSFFHPDQVKEILVTQARDCVKGDRYKQVLGSVDGNGLIVSEGEFWAKQRRIIQPAFNHNCLANYAEAMVAETKRTVASWEPGAMVDMAAEMTGLTLMVANRVFFNIDVKKEAQELASAVDVITKALYRDFGALVLLPDWLPIPSKIEKRRAIATIDAVIARALKEHRSSPNDSKDVLSMLISAADTEGDGSKMSDEQIRDEAMTLFNAGHDSTAAALAWTWWLLLKHPDTYEQLISDLDNCLEGRKIDLSLLPRIPLLAAVAKESLRLYPPAWSIPRQAAADIELGGYKVPGGSFLNIFPWVTQRDSRFFDRPEEFLPERFLPENERHHHPFAFFPFGAGGHACIGKEFALMEMQLVIATICQQYQLQLAPNQQDVKPNPLISLEPKGGVQVIVSARR